MLYLYGITDARQPPEPPPPGLENGAAGMVRLDGIAAVTGQLQQGRPEASERHLREHFRVVEAFMASHTVLPVRFGTVFAGREELQAHLARAHDMYSSDLRRLRGQIELGIKASRRTALAHLSEPAAAFAPAGSGPGTRYLAGKRAMAARSLAQRRQAEDLAGIISAPLASHLTRTEWRALPGPSGEAGVSMAFLLRKERIGAFREALAALRTSEPDLDILLTGPWPPYSFVSVLGEAEALPTTF